MNIEISKEESNVISIVRILAMASIVLCHILQAYGSPLAWRFNVGVQIFLVLSGYLYGHKEIHSWFFWFWQRFKKLYIPCFLYCTTALIVLHIFAGQNIRWTNFITISAVDGISHLWFMKAIFLCYAFTPILSYLRRWPALIYVMLIISGIAEFGCFHIAQDVFSWIWLYSMGYFFPLLKDSYKRYTLFLFGVLAITITIFLQFSHDWNMTDLWHYICGVALCIIPIQLIRFEGSSAIIKKLDSYSFHIYITHHIYLVGPLSLVPLFSSAWIAIPTILCLIAISAIILKLVSDSVIKFL